jgi:hypothetical protein
MLAAATCGLTVAEYAPLSIKSSVTGYGLAAKEQVQFMVTRLLSLERPARLARRPPTRWPSPSATSTPRRRCSCKEPTGERRARGVRSFGADAGRKLDLCERHRDLDRPPRRRPEHSHRWCLPLKGKGFPFPGTGHNS